MKRFLVVLSLAIASCSYSIHEVYVSDFEAYTVSQENIVEANTEQFVVLGFAFDTDYVNQAYHEIQAQCEGQIKGITTQFSTSHGFFSWTNKIRIQGICIK